MSARPKGGKAQENEMSVKRHESTADLTPNFLEDDNLMEIEVQANEADYFDNDLSS